MIRLGLVPHYTTLQKAARRLLRQSLAERLLGKTLRLAQVVGRLPARVSLAAGDGTGWESHHVSQYFIKRRNQRGKCFRRTSFTKFPKAGVLCDTASHFILAVVPERGPGPDITHLRPLLNQGLRRFRIDTVALDAKHVHRVARNERGMQSLIPPKSGRPTDKPLTSYWRRQMAARLHSTQYTQR